MRLKLSTKVQAPWHQVAEGFTQELFLALNPPFPPVKLLRFDGCKKDDLVSLELNFILFKQKWDSLITFSQFTDDSFVFVDEGVKLPFFLKSWKHTHNIAAYHDGATIMDDITYTTGTILTDVLMFPLLYVQFLYRNPIYKRVFRLG